MDCPKFWISKNVQFRHMCGAFRFWSNFGWPKIWANPCLSPHSIALACYPWLILVINCENEVCSCSNNTVSKAFWWKKVLLEQKISCCGVIYRSGTVNSKSFVSKVLLRIKFNFELTVFELPFPTCNKWFLLVDIRGCQGYPPPLGPNCFNFM